MKKYYQHTRRWFVNRIGKRIYRKPLSCSCSGCQKGYVDIWDGRKDGKQEHHKEFHADYIFLCHNEMGIKYYDKT